MNDRCTSEPDHWFLGPKAEACLPRIAVALSGKHLALIANVLQWVSFRRRCRQPFPLAPPRAVSAHQGSARSAWPVGDPGGTYRYDRPHLNEDATFTPVKADRPVSSQASAASADGRVDR